MKNMQRSSFKTIFKYVAAEAAFSFFIAFLFFFFVFFVNQILLMAEQILSKRAPLLEVILLIFYSLPSVVAMAAPFASLVGILMALGRLSADNEILIMRASGLSHLVIYTPIIIVGLFISILSFFANDILLPAGTLEFGKVYRRLLVSTPALELESNSIKRYKNTLIITGEVIDKAIDNVLIMDRTNDGQRRLIMASRASLLENQSNSLVLDLHSAFIHNAGENAYGDYDYSFAETLQYAIRQQDIMQAATNPGPREMSSRDVLSEIKKKEITLFNRIDQRKIKNIDNILILDRILKDGKELLQWNQIQNHSVRLENELKSIQEISQDRVLSSYKLEYYKKFSIPFGALCFVFLATPLALFTKKSGQATGFGIGLIISVLYWALLIGGQTLGVRMRFDPFLAMWLPNILILFTGTLLSLVRMSR
jgi:lipopolysaccharide export system permease protein